MKTYISMIKSLLLISTLIGIISLNSCVSTHKYEEMVAHRDSLSVSNDSLSMVINDYIAKIQQKDKEIQQLTTANLRMNSELFTTKKNYDQLKANSNSETKTLLSNLEDLQLTLLDRELKIKDINAKLKSRDEKIQKIKEQLKTALLGFEGSGLSIDIKDGKVYVSLSNQLLFATGSTTIDKKGLEAIKFLSEVVNNTSDISILVEGHTDNQVVGGGSRFKDNWELSVLRATEVVKFMQEVGKVEPTRLSASGRGEYLPLEAGDSPEARAKNRRTEVIIIPKLDILYNILD